MIGFDGDSQREADLRAALVGLFEVFPEHLAKASPPTWFEPDEIARNAHFDAILRAHKKDRLGIPIQALRMTGSSYHGFDLINPRRLAWFVPTLLASWLERAQSFGESTFGAADIKQMTDDASVVDVDWTWTEEESAALDAFFATALAAALATPLAPAREPEPELARPLEDGVRVWSLHSPSVPLDVLCVAKALRVDLDPLIFQWTLDSTELAFDHLLEAVYDTTIPAKRYLAHEAVADRLGEGFFDASEEKQVRLSKAEKTVRRNIARREDF